MNYFGVKNIDDEAVIDTQEQNIGVYAM